MASHYEQSLQRDLDLIRKKVSDMAGHCERALRDVLRAFVEGSRQLAYLVILRDQNVDELEKQIDRLCLEFLVRQQPVAGPLRFVYATIKINAELERIGDYSESIARQVLKLDPTTLHLSYEPFTEAAEAAIGMLGQAVKAFVNQDADLARNTMAIEEKVDVLRRQIDADLVRLRQEDRIPLDALTPLMTISRRFERVSDQAKNICSEVLYMCTGEYAKHKGAEAFRILFVDEHNASPSQMAEAIGGALRQPRLVFNSAGLEPRPLDPRTVSFLAQRGVDISRNVPKSVEQVPNLEHYQVIIALDEKARRAFPPRPKTVCLDWTVRDLSTVQGSDAEVQAAYAAAYENLQNHIHDLAEAILGQAE